MDDHGLYNPDYSNSYALVIGIDEYRHVGPLAYAANDARGVARTLIEKFTFPAANVIVLLDREATKAAVLKTYMTFADPQKIERDDRIFFFFAGHGHTVSARRDTGFLIPVDGTIDDLASLIRWDELTRNADLIPAKHMLFVMDACYGGLAVRRKIAPTGSMRLLQDLLQRYSR